MLPLLVKVESLFVNVVVCAWLSLRSRLERSHWMVGGGLPVAEQVKVTSTASSSCSVLEVCTAVVTSEIPGETSEMSRVAFYWVHFLFETPQNHQKIKQENIQGYVSNRKWFWKTRPSDSYQLKFETTTKKILKVKLILWHDWKLCS